MKLQLSSGANAVIAQLNQAGFLAYAIGGCVRDLLMGKTPQDYDVATNALPEQIQQTFCDTVDTGSRFGTITVWMEGEPVEVTTFRQEGGYQDGRHPDAVTFVADLRQDVFRRDFTINGLAFHPEEGLIDLVGGRNDIRKKKVRTIGDPDRRFAEDGLRLLRAVRLACVLDFAVEDETRASMARNKEKLFHASIERIWTETRKTLVCEKGERLGEFTDILQLVFPELAPAMGFEQHHPYHHLSVWQHTLLAFGAIEPELGLRITMLFHDSGKPLTCSMGEDGNTHFYGHAEVGMELAEKALTRMRCNRHTIEKVLRLIQYHDIELQPQDKQIKLRLHQFGEKTFFDLLKVKRADNGAKHPDKMPQLMAYLDEIEGLAKQIIRRGDCYDKAHLAIRGSDLIGLGMPQSQEIGKTLDWLLRQVILEELPNEKEALLQKVREQRKETRSGLRNKR